MNASTFSAPRVAPNALHALGGIWRLASRRFFTPGYWFIVAGALVLLAITAIAALPNPGQPKGNFYPWAGSFYIGLVVPLLSFIFSASATRDDLGPASVDYMLTRPVPRPLYVLFRYLAQLLCAQIDFLISMGLVVAVGLYIGTPDLPEALPLLLLAQTLAVAVYTAAGVLCAQLTHHYMLIGLAYGAVVEVGISTVPTQFSHISLLRHLHSLLNSLVGEEGWLSSALRDPLSAPAAVAVLLGFIAMALAISATLFSYKEFMGAAGKES